jgi:lysophospholipase L1-like esterase
MTTCPGADAWDTYEELANAARRAAADKQAGLADTYLAFHAVGPADRDSLFVHDRVHLSPAGHQLVLQTVMGALAPTAER